MPDVACHVCRSGQLRSFPSFTPMSRVTSDAKPFPAGGELAVCEGCGTVQKPITTAWHAEIDAIYRAYTIYHNAGGAEQNVFSGGGGQPASRSSRLVQQVRDRVGLPTRGRMLDVGCGNGAMLRSFGELMPGWSLAGSELSDKYRDVVEAIPRVEKLYPGQPEDVLGTFGVITLLHVLEHVPDPVAFLTRLAPKLGVGGLLVAQVPDYRHSAFDLAVADHCTHFAPATLAAVFAAAGFEVTVAADDFIPKELTLVARPGATATPLPRSCPDLAGVIGAVERQLRWLAELSRLGHSLTGPDGVGVFGTSLGGAWLLGELGPAVGFFVDEDAAKVGKTWDGRPILAPSEIRLDANVVIGLPGAIAEQIGQRVGATGRGRYHFAPAA